MATVTSTRWKVWPYWITSFLIIALLSLSIMLEKYFFLAWVMFVILPIVDQILPLDTANPTKEEEKLLEKESCWQIPLYVTVIVEVFASLYILNFVATNELTFMQLGALAYTMGVLGSLGMIVGHELFHKTDKFGTMIGIFTLCKQQYGHFYIAHLKTHHKWVATVKDCSSARFGQSFWDFVPQTLAGSYTKSWDIEKKRLLRAGSGVWNPNNRMLQSHAIQLLIIASIYRFLGPKCVLFYLVQASYSILLLELTNYIRHYGLERKELSPGVYEQCDIKHSWNAPQLLQNIFLMNLQRHSDHHANAYKQYQTLCSYSESPQLPMGYTVCLKAAMFPSVWFDIVDPLAKETNDLGKPTDEAMKKSESTLNRFIAAQSIALTILLLLS